VLPWRYHETLGPPVAVIVFVSGIGLDSVIGMGSEELIKKAAIVTSNINTTPVTICLRLYMTAPVRL